MEASKNGNREIAQLLLEKGSDPNQINTVSTNRVGYTFEAFDRFFTNIICLQENWTALMAAANNGRFDTVDILLQYGANPDMQDRVSLSVLQLINHV